jgi:nitrogen fixation protein NifB
MKVALATSDGAFVSKHFGDTPYFLVAEVDSQGWRIIEKRENVPVCDHAERNHDRFDKSAAVISDCGAVICARIGNFVQGGLRELGIQPLEKAGFCDEILDGYVKYLGKQKKPNL